MTDAEKLAIGPWQPVRLCLPDGTPVEIAPIGPDHGERLQAALAALSPESRYQRFLGGIERFSSQQLRYLTSTDGFDHLACFMSRPRPDGSPEDLGVCRCVRNPRHPARGEVAIVVADAWQQRGVGSALMRELASRCRKVGIREWQAEMLAENEGVQRLLDRFGQLEGRDFPEPGVMKAVYRLRDEQEIRGENHG